jgi:transcription initiation factor TFIID subunit TAF12
MGHPGQSQGQGQGQPKVKSSGQECPLHTGSGSAEGQQQVPHRAIWPGSE